MGYYAPTNSMPTMLEQAPIYRLKAIIDSMQANVAGRGVASKAFTNEGDQEILQVIISSYERDVRLARDVENQLKRVFDGTVEKVLDQYEEIYGEPVTIKLLNEQVANDALGFGYVNVGAGAFMGNAETYLRSYMIRVVRNYIVTSDEDEEMEE